MGSSPRKASPWPPLVALGIATSEVGVLFGLVPVAVGGVLLFGWSTANVVREAGYAEGAWRPLRHVGVVIGAAGALAWALRASALTPDAFFAAAETDAIAVRAAVVLLAATVLVVAGFAGRAVAARG